MSYYDIVELPDPPPPLWMLVLVLIYFAASVFLFSLRHQWMTPTENLLHVWQAMEALREALAQ